MERVGFKAAPEEAKRLLNDEHSCLQLVTKSRIIILSPRFIGKILSGICEALDREVNLYSDLLEGVLVSYSNIKLHKPLSLTHGDKPYLHLDVQADYVVFKPYIGCTLKGVVNKLSYGHIGCLVHKCFNASIPKPDRQSDKDWNGNHLKQGDEFLFKVIGVSTGNKVLFIKGALLEENTIPKADNSQDPIKEESTETESSNRSGKKKKKKKSKNHDNDESLVDTPEQDQALNVDDKKRKRSHDTDVDSGIVDSENDMRETECKRIKLDIEDNESLGQSHNSLDLSQTVGDSDLHESISSSKKHKKKKKHKHKNKEK